jgi:virulence factor Mce-like protein
MKGPIEKFPLHVATFAAFVAVAFGFLAWFVGLGGGLPSFGETYEVRAVVPTAASLAPGARVTMAGVAVGSVTDVQRRGLGALVHIEVDDDAVTPIPRDSRLRVRQRTPVGENYVTIDAGRSGKDLPSKGVLPMTQAVEYVDVDQILSVFQGQSRDRLRLLIRGAGEAVDGRGAQLNSLVGHGSGALKSGSKVVETLVAQRAEVSRLVEGLGRVSAAIGERDASIRELARSGIATTRAIAARDERVRELLEELPSTLARVRATSGTVSSVTDRSTPVVKNLTAALRDVRPAVQSLQPAAQEGRAVVSRLSAAAPPLTKTLRSLRALSGPASKALPEVSKTLCQANPVIRYARPYTADVISALGGLGSAANSYDAIGHVIRLVPIVSENTLVALPDDVSAAAHRLLKTGLLGKTTGGLNWNPYPKPGRIGKDGADENGFLGPDALGKSGFEYPHVEADC